MEIAYSPKQQKKLDELKGYLTSFDEIFLASCKDYGWKEIDAKRELLSCPERQEILKNIGIVMSVEIRPTMIFKNNELIDV